MSINVGDKIKIFKTVEEIKANQKHLNISIGSSIALVFLGRTGTVESIDGVYDKSDIHRENYVVSFSATASRSEASYFVYHYEIDHRYNRYKKLYKFLINN